MASLVIILGPFNNYQAIYYTFYTFHLNSHLRNNKKHGNYERCLSNWKVGMETEGTYHLNHSSESVNSNLLSQQQTLVVYSYTT